MAIHSTIKKGILDGRNSKYRVRQEVLTIGIVAVILMPLLSCSGKRPANLGIHDSVLARCPSTSNCVSSDSPGKRGIKPFTIAEGSAADMWQLVVEAATELPRTRIVQQTDTYLHAECRSAFFGFADDLELHLRPAEGIIAVRSASRLGSKDFGVNRKRVEKLRASFVNKSMTN